MVAGFVFAIISCNNHPLDKKYNEESFDKDIKEMLESKKVDTTDVTLIITYVILAETFGEDLDNKTYKDLLYDAIKLRNKAEKAVKEKEERRQLFDNVLTVTLRDKGYRKGDWEDYLTYEIAYENKSEKDIRAVKGSILITDLFDSEIKKIELVGDEVIPAGKIVKKLYTTKYNQFKDEDTRLRSKSIKDIKVVWTPEKIIFGDGSTLE